MKSLFSLVVLMMSFMTVSLASNSNVTVNNSQAEDVAPVGKITVYGEYIDSTFETVYHEDGSTTTTMTFDCDPESSNACYSAELSPSGDFEVGPIGVEPIKGLLIDSNPAKHWYKVKSNQ